MNIVPLPNAVDIPAMLRAAADRIDAGEHPDLQFIVAIFVDRNTAFTAYGYGKMSALEAVGAMARAVSKDLVNT